MNYLDFYPKILLNCSKKYSLHGHSKAGNMTGFWIPELKFVLDAGIIIKKQPNAVFITHSHTDHSQMLPNIITCRSKETPIYINQSTFEPLKLLQHSIISLSNGFVNNDSKEDVFTLQKNNIIIVKPNEIIQYKDNILIEIFNCYHSCESIGFGFNTIDKKIKPEFSNIDKNELIKIKKEKSITYDVINPQFIFFGDTNIDVLIKNNKWKQYPSIIIECTGYPTVDNLIKYIHDYSNEINNDLYDKSWQNYYKIGHIHLFDLIPILKENNNTQFILIHSSDSINNETLIEINLLLNNFINKNIIISI